jgi:hypothetical protein
VRFLVTFSRFWYEFIVGEAWEIAAGVVAVLGIAVALLRTHGVDPALIPLVVALGVGLVLGGSLLAEVRRRRRAGPQMPSSEGSS